MDIGLAIGPIPAWMQLGPVVEIDGLPAREVLGDWSHLAPCDRPPKYMREDSGIHNYVSGFDRSETREPVKQIRPGRHISELKNIHSGACALLFNGPSIADHDLHRIKLPLIGMNRTHSGFKGYSGPQPDYLCVVDWAWLDLPKLRPGIVSHPRVINGSDHREEIGWRVTRHPRMAPFSFDLARDGYAGPVPATTGHLALQVAVWMGFTTLYCLGFDLGGGHFDGTRGSFFFNDAVRYHQRQVARLEERGIKVYVVGSPKSRAPFPHVTFEEMLAMPSEVAA